MIKIHKIYIHALMIQWVLGSIIYLYIFYFISVSSFHVNEFSDLRGGLLVALFDLSKVEFREFM